MRVSLHDRVGEEADDDLEKRLLGGDDDIRLEMPDHQTAGQEASNGDVKTHVNGYKNPSYLPDSMEFPVLRGT